MEDDDCFIEKEQSMELEKNTTATVINYNIGRGGQVNINYGNGILTAEQNNKCYNCDNEIIKKVTIVNKVYTVQQSVNNNSSSQSNDTVMFVLGIAFIAVGVFIQYKNRIQVGMLIAALVIGFLTIVTYYIGERKNMYFDKNIKSIVVFNIVSIFVIPLLMWLIDNPIFFKGVEYSLLKQQIESKGLVPTILNTEVGPSVLYQMTGVILTGFFLIYILVSDIYIVALVNVVNGSVLQPFWHLLLRKTCGRTKNGAVHIIYGLLILMICYTMITGITPNVLKVIQNMSID
ncbi:hypothetical protein ACTQ6A_07600 [Lachnospiraceae bacterium LCP25S3_G4]